MLEKQLFILMKPRSDHSIGSDLERIHSYLSEDLDNRIFETYV
jgi:hypothetical protein